MKMEEDTVTVQNSPRCNVYSELLVFLLPTELGAKANKVSGVKNVPLSAIQTYTSEAYCSYLTKHWIQINA